MDLIGAAPKPIAKVLNVTESGVLLKCEVRGAFPEPKVEWKDSDGNTLPAEKPHILQDQTGHFFVTLLTTVAKSKTNRFLCTAKQEEIYHITEDDVFVPGAAPKPSIITLDETKDWALLQCEVHGASPKPQLQWQDSGGNMVPAKDPQVTDRGGSYDIILQTTVTKTDHYRCVATQEEINHQVYAETFVNVNAPGISTAAVVGAVIGALMVGVCAGTGITVLVKKHHIRQSQTNMTGSVCPPTEKEHLNNHESSGQQNNQDT